MVHDGECCPLVKIHEIHVEAFAVIFMIYDESQCVFSAHSLLKNDFLSMIHIEQLPCRLCGRIY